MTIIGKTYTEIFFIDDLSKILKKELIEDTHLLNCPFVYDMEVEYHIDDEFYGIIPSYYTYRNAIITEINNVFQIRYYSNITSIYTILNINNLLNGNII